MWTLRVIKVETEICSGDHCLRADSTQRFPRTRDRPGVARASEQSLTLSHEEIRCPASRVKMSGDCDREAVERIASRRHSRVSSRGANK